MQEVVSPSLSSGDLTEMKGSVPATGAKLAFRQENSAVLKLKGLPYSTSDEQVAKFFEGFKIKRVAFVYEPDGRPSGLAFAEFETKEEALRALAKNGEYIGERYVRLLHVPKQEMEEQVRMGTLAIPGAAAKLRQRLMRAQRASLAYAAGPMQLMPGVQGVPPVPNVPMAAATRPVLGVGPGNTAYQQAMAGQQVPMDMGRLWPGYQSSPAALAAQFSSMSLNGGAMAPGAMARGPIQAPQAGMMAPANIPNPSSQILGGNRNMQLAGSTVKIRGLPYRSTPTEILAFFQGYQFLPETLQIGLDGLGRPSGEAWITFLSSDEALRAVRDLNRHYLGNRYLELNLC